ncbi:MAG: DUF1211 domain-containing protein [Bacteroidetes bacterium]|nr:DUF1211 domain-containing protein [Bacteroidota bacterium]
MNKNRLEAFSDGVFAIVITLLILNVKIPHTPYHDLLQALTAMLPAISAYILSFLLIGMYWVFHHNAFTHIAQVDGVLLWLNIILLLFISFLPFPAMLMGEYPFTTIPVVVYGCNLLLANGTGFIMFLYLMRNKSLATPAFSAKVMKIQLTTYITVNILYIIAIIIGFYKPTISLIIFAVMAVSLIVRSAVTTGIGHRKRH